MERILQIVTYMGRGGLETMLMNYYRHIDREKMQFDFLVHRLERADYDDEIEALGGKIYRLPYLNPFSFSYLKELNNFFEEHKEYRIVHSHLDCMSSVPLKAAKMHGIPVRIAHSHNSNQDRNLKYIMKLVYKSKIPAVATTLFACSEDAGGWMFGNHPYRILANAIDAKAYSLNQQRRRRLRAQFGLQDNLTVGHVGRFRAQKNHTFLIDIFYEIKNRIPDARLLLVGDGDEETAVRKKVEKSGLQNSVLFLGARNDVAELMQIMDVFVLPSLYEGLPVTVIEAQASGLPCLISDKVPIECKKTDLVQQVPLSADVKIWADAVTASVQAERRDTYEEIKESGFDISENAKWLQEFYEKAAGEKE
ncbi:MAG: glycosyltransferase family 1 protein [Eubacteriales bacterium]|nr:glycosyltransferase family 1 protein [Eubacteriales bacterium]